MADNFAAARMPFAHFLARLVGSRFVVRALSRLNVWIYRASGGRLANRIDGRPICLVTLARRRSGKPAMIPLMYTPHGEDVLLVASLGGAPDNPAWYHNVKHHPRVSVQLGRHRRNMMAREALGAERERLWPVVVASFPAYEAYQRKTTRMLPILVCSPISGDV